VIRAALAAVLVGCAATTGCASPPPAPATATAGPADPRWQDVFAGTPELLLVVFPKEVRRDKVYGSLLRRAIEVARESSHAVTETRTLDAMEDADEVILGVRPRSPGVDGETTVVVRGAPTGVDPARLVDSDGHPLWTPGPLAGTERIRELVRVPPAHVAPDGVPEGGAEADDGPLDASLFELPGATWIITSGVARARARAALARPTARPSPPLAEGVLAAARIDGASLVAHVPPLGPRGLLANVGARLQSATFALPPGAERALRVTLAYADEGAARGAADRARIVVETVARTKPDRTSWLSALSAASVSRSGTEVVVEAPLPEPLIDALLGLNRL
jgi:hypothetical protein